MQKNAKYYTILAIFLVILPIYLFIFHENTNTRREGSVNTANNNDEFSLDIQSFQTKAGTRVLFLEREELPIVDARIVFDAGSRHDADSWGMAYLTAATLFTGAGELTEDDIAKQFEEIGARFSASAGREMATVSFRSLSDRKLLKKATNLMQAVLKSPNFDTAPFELMQQRMLIALQESKEDPSHIAYEKFYDVLYKDTPYSHLPTGDQSHVTALTSEGAKQFYQQYYDSKNALVVIVGALSKRHAEKLAEELTEYLPQSNREQESNSYTPDFRAGKTDIDFVSSQTHILAGVPFITYEDPDYFSLYVGNHILGGNAMLSRIFKDVRETRGLAYDARSYFIPMQIKGPYIFGLQTKNESKREAMQVLKETVTKFIEEGPTEEELTLSKQNLNGKFVLSLDNNSAIADYLSVLGFYDLPLDYVQQFKQNIKEVTIEDIQQAFKTRVNVDDWAVIAVGRASKNN